jgi:hypothetical protein
LVLRPAERRSASAYRDVIRDPDPSVASAAVAALCRSDGREGGAGGGAPVKSEPIPAPLLEVARTLVMAQGTPSEDAVEILGCVARSASPADRQIVDQLRRGAPSPLRDRAVELAESPDRLKPR